MTEESGSDKTGGFNRKLFNDVVNTAYIYFVTYSKLPTANDIKSRTPYKYTEINNVLESVVYQQTMKARGLPIEVRKGLTAQQNLLLAYLTDPTSRDDLDKRLKKAGVSYSTYRAWMRDPIFNASLTDMTDQMLRDNVSGVDNALLRQALRGNLNAIQYYHQLTGRFDPNQQSQLEIMGVLNTVVEIISRHVQDPQALMGISTDMQELAEKLGLVKKTSMQQLTSQREPTEYDTVYKASVFDHSKDIRGELI